MPVGGDDGVLLHVHHNVGLHLSPLLLIFLILRSSHSLPFLLHVPDGDGGLGGAGANADGEVALPLLLAFLHLRSLVLPG